MGLDKPPENIRQLSITKQIGKLEYKLNNECLSDQEIEETLQNIEKLRLELNDSAPIQLENKTIEPIKQTLGKELIGMPAKGTTTLGKLHHFIKTVGKKKPEPPATMDEVHQLKIEYQKAKLNELIAKAKANTPKKKSKLLQILTDIHNDNQSRQTRTRNNSRQKKSNNDNPSLGGLDYDRKEHESRILKGLGVNERNDNVRKYLKL